MIKQKILIITYYWPPGGGAGVQRWVKLTKYLNQYHIIPYVLTVHENHASYMQTDPGLAADVAPGVTVCKTKSFEPINYYSRIVGRKNVPAAGFSNAGNKKLSGKLIRFIRSHLFIPDPRKGWNAYAYKKAVEIIKTQNIALVITSSPPHSTQLIGLKLQKKLRVKWIADLRDPWTDIYYYKLLGHSFLSKLRDRYLEKKVLINADAIITVSHSLKKLFAQKSAEIDPSKIHILPNGYDEDDFKNLKTHTHKEFTICYTGTMADSYKPSVFFHALKRVAALNPDSTIKLQCVGNIPNSIKKQITEAELNADFIPPVSHHKVVEYQKNADLLLLVIPDTENPEGILTGKLFEYLASGNPIICIGPEHGDAARIIKDCAAGVTFNRNREQTIMQYIEDVLQNTYKNKPDWTEIANFSREKQAGEIRKIIDQLL